MAGAWALLFVLVVLVVAFEVFWRVALALLLVGPAAFAGVVGALWCAREGASLWICGLVFLAAGLIVRVLTFLILSYVIALLPGPLRWLAGARLSYLVTPTSSAYFAAPPAGAGCGAPRGCSAAGATAGALLRSG